MPYARISMLRGRPVDTIRAISAGVQRAMEAAFDLPPGDCFQAIQQHDPHEPVFDRHYLCGPRSDGFLLIAITTGRPRSDAVKRAFYARLVDELAPAGVRLQDVMVVVTTTGLVDWSFGAGLATLAPGQ